MSNSLSIAAVSAAFQRSILAAANAAVPTATVRIGTPTAKLSEDANPLVNLHLYRVEPNLTQNNEHLPTRNDRGDTRSPSKLPLNLHYILTFYGDHEKFEADLMLGSVMLALEHKPLLIKSTITAAINDADELEDSDLDKSIAKLRVTRQLMSIDDFSKVWSIFYQVPYALSLAYEVSHIVIESQEVAPIPAPVAQVGLWVSPIAELRLDETGSSANDTFPPVWGGVLFVRGAGLNKVGLTLEVNANTLVLTDVVATSSELQLPLNSATFGGDTLEVGVHRLQAISPPVNAEQPEHLRTRSNAIAFALNPSITLGAHNAPAGGASATGTLTVNFVPGINPSQSIRLLLDNRNPNTPSHVVLSGRDAADPGALVASLDFEFTDLPRGNYLVRADVDGLISPVSIDSTEGSASFGQIVGPVLSL